MKRKIPFVLLALFIFQLSACAGSKSSSSAATEISPTIYYRPVINTATDRCSSNDLHDVKDPSGKTLVSLCVSSYKKCLQQGSCLVVDKGREKSLGYSGLRGGEPRFVQVSREECPYGRGVDDPICLDPYFSVAADLSVYKAGDVIYIPALRGVKLPDGQIHDGYLIIRDEGGGVKGPTRFDFFTGYLNYSDKRNTLARLGFGDPDSRFSFQMVGGELAEKVRRNRNYPGLPRRVLQNAP
jgi:hypothetical protein